MGREGFESFFKPVVGGAPHKIMWGARGGESWENKFLCILCRYGKRHKAIRLTRGPQDCRAHGSVSQASYMIVTGAGEASEKERRVEREEL